MKPHTCTFTGVDDHTDLATAAALSREYSRIEYGILFSRTRSGVENRYPKDAVSIARDLRDRHPGIKLALHVCGRAVFELVSGSPGMLEATSLFDRIQLNFAIGRVPFDANQLAAWIHSFARPVITQHNAANTDLASQINAPNHQILFDASGGAGLRPSSWPRADTRKACGFAGGIGPESILEDLAAIESENAEKSYWIDMEQRIRTDDSFDISKCESVCVAIAR